MSLMPMEKLSLLILTAISFVILFSSFSSASSLNLTLDSPQGVTAEEEFDVDISVEGYNMSATYDIKIYVNDDTSANSEIYNPTTNNWQSSHNYVIASFPGLTEYKIMSHCTGETKICFQVRQTNKSYDSSNSVCNSIVVDEAPEPPPSDNSNDSPNDTEDDNSSNQSDNSSSDSSPYQSSSSFNSRNASTTLKSSNSSPQSVNSNPIVLTSKTISQPSSIFMTSQERFYLYIVLGFTIFCVILIILLALKFL